MEEVIPCPTLFSKWVFEKSIPQEKNFFPYQPRHRYYSWVLIGFGKIAKPKLAGFKGV